MKPVTVEYRDANDKRTKFEDKTTVNLEINGSKEHMELLINNHKIIDRATLKRKFHKLVTQNHTVKNMGIYFQWKERGKRES